MLESRLRRSILNILTILGFTVLIVVICYFLDLWFLELYQKNIGGAPLASLRDLFFLQGVLLIILGFIALFRGIYMSLQGRSTSLRETQWGTSIGRWLARDDTRLDLTIVFSGAIMILIYFLNL